ncbi:amino acid/amide ABC transporter substrate-binding protein (HAAT family) [Stella humosa]|uniref:Amino acid/amide ABC transporter substrate-binding protein (HAAT family) n=1 Tax=Stella humosa TaxID=94 RepID=A0A3N1LI19_9PROT|nr:penicillin-binding protein activator [Stella humosa]ROP90864.1 amino acid/amide ABC transporter substrate-binding protein (HAAT family) [Stella humosa]BBK34787.1 penicillin-binding protein activator [Stella humosa]
MQPPPVVEAPPPPAPAPNPMLGGISRGGAQVALLLPLRGQHAALGNAMLEAAQMALLDAGQNNGGMTLVPRDTNGTAEGAEAAVRKALDDGAALILGPLFSHEVRAAAGPARERGVAVIAFTNDADVAADGVFVMGLHPRPQIRRVVEEAAAAGGKRFSILAPASPYGQRGAQAAEEAVPRVGGTIVSVEFYDPGGADSQETARRLARQPADFVVLPEAPARAVTLAPLYSYYETRGNRAKFLGTQLWDDPSMWREPALYGSWFAAPPAEARIAFTERFTALQGRQPPRIATLPYDATALAVALARQPGGADFSVDAITRPNGFAGVEGLFRFRRDGLSDRALAIMEIRRGQPPAVVRPAPTAFDDRGS